MTTHPKRTVLVTGAGSGIGEAIATHLHARGWQVFATMPHVPPSNERPTDGLIRLPMDVTDEASVRRCVDTVQAHVHRLDAVVNNAGTTLLGAAEETSVDEAQALFNLNLFGTHRVNQAVLPLMRAQRSGRLITISSVVGRIPKPFEAFYVASKHALEGYTETLDQEIRRFGLRAVLIEPGFTYTDIDHNARRAARRLPDYEGHRLFNEDLFHKDILRGSKPLTVAKVVEKALSAKNPQQRYTSGADALMFSLARHLLPDGLFNAGLRQRFRLH